MKQKKFRWITKVINTDIKENFWKKKNDKNNLH